MDGPKQAPLIGLALAAVLVLSSIAAFVYLSRAPKPTVPPSRIVARAPVAQVSFDASAFARVIGNAEFLSNSGLVNYPRLKENPGDLVAFIHQVRMVSPRSNRAAFPSEQHALAYWINAHNAWVLHAVLEAYPVKSVKDITPSLLEAKGRVCGGEDLSLIQIQDEIVRKQFADPRVHFALNRATVGCPWLPREPFDGARLDEQLEKEARRFFRDPSHLRVEEGQKLILLSPILDWYGEDFLRWLKENRGLADPRIRDYVKLYAPTGLAEKIKPDYRVAWQDYDWSLNDAGAEKPPARPQID